MSRWFENLFTHATVDDVEPWTYFNDHRNYFNIGTIELINGSRGIPSVGGDLAECCMPDDGDFYWEVTSFSEHMRKHVETMKFNDKGSFEYGGSVDFDTGWVVYTHFVQFTGVGATLHFKEVSND